MKHVSPVYLVWLFVTLGLLGASGKALYYDMQLRERMVDVEGTVVRSGYSGMEVQNTEGESVYEYVSVVAFVDRDGVDRTIHTDDHLTVGSAYAFRYDPNSPTEFSTGGGRLLGILLGLFGLASLGLLVRMLIGERQAAKA